MNYRWFSSVFFSHTDEAGSCTILHCYCEINTELLLLVYYGELLGQIPFCKGLAAFHGFIQDWRGCFSFGMQHPLEKCCSEQSWTTGTEVLHSEVRILIFSPWFGDAKLTLAGLLMCSVSLRTGLLHVKYLFMLCLNCSMSRYELVFSGSCSKK